MEEYVVEMRDVVKSFYGSTVLHHVNIGLRAARSMPSSAKTAPESLRLLRS